MTVKTLTKEPFNLLVAGVGGQGNIVVSYIIGNVLISKGYLVVIGETYGASQRGGAVMSHMRISKENTYGSLIPAKGADIIFGMEPMETLRALTQYGNPNVITIVNPRPIYTMAASSGAEQYLEIDKLLETIKELCSKTWVINSTDEAKKIGDPRMSNVILIGALAALDILPLDKESLEIELQERFPKAIEANMEALNRGIELIVQSR